MRRDIMQIITLLGVLTIVIVIVALFNVRSMLTAPEDRYLSVPRVQAGYISSDGKQHTLEANFSVSLRAAAADSVDAAALNRRVERIVQELSFDRLSSKDGTQYVKDAILSGISDLVKPSDVLGIYVTDIHADFSLAEAPRYEAGSGERNFLRSIFPNLGQ